MKDQCSTTNTNCILVGSRLHFAKQPAVFPWSGSIPRQTESFQAWPVGYYRLPMDAVMNLFSTNDQYIIAIPTTHPLIPEPNNQTTL